MRWLILVVFGASLSAGAQQAQFCSVSRFGVTNCHHASLDSCQRSAQAQGGQCLVSTQSAPPCKGYNFGGGVCSDPMAAYDEAYRRAREAREQQEQDVARQRAQQPRNDWPALINAIKRPQSVVYQCTRDGQIVMQDFPMVGCVVSEVRY